MPLMNEVEKGKDFLMVHFFFLILVFEHLFSAILNQKESSYSIFWSIIPRKAVLIQISYSKIFEAH